MNSTDSYEEMDRNPYKNILDDTMDAYKKETQLISKGYLNHNTLNQAFERALVLHDQEQRDEWEESRLKQGGLGSFVDLLEEYDSIQPNPSTKTQTSPQAKTQADIGTRKSQHKSSRIKIIPNTNLTLTKSDHYKSIRAIHDDYIVQKDQFTSSRLLPKEQKLQDYYTQLEEELNALECPTNGPDFNRLAIYSHTFDTLIQEFKTYGPLLADIKKVYDGIISHFQLNQQELDTLRSKVQKLYANNENRLLL